MALTHHLQRIFASRSNETALVLPQGEVTYSQLEDSFRAAMGWLLHHEVSAGDRIAVQMSPGLESVILLLASLFAGTVLVPLNPRYTETETRIFLEDAEAALYVQSLPVAAATGSPSYRVFDCRPGCEARARQILADRTELVPLFQRHPPAFGNLGDDPHDLRLLCYTSGTTGKQKGAMITSGNLEAVAASLHQAWGWSPADALLHALPLFHVHGLLVALLGALYAGASTVLLPRFDPSLVIKHLDRQDFTIFMGVPTMYRRLLSAAPLPFRSCKRVRLFTCGSAPLAPDIFQDFRQRFGHTILERYGMTETGMVLSNPLDGDRKPGCVGLPLPGVEVKVVDPHTGQILAPGNAGELLIRGPGVCKGYWRRPDADQSAFLAGGWFRSGDLASQDPDGYFRIVGRLKELIITGGFNVYPREVEQVLEGHPAILETAVFGQPDPDLGERVCAAVVPRPGAIVTESDLITFCRRTLAAYKCPRQVRLVRALPRNTMGKLVRGELRSSPEEG